MAGALGAIGFTLAVFGVIVLHELGHALTARHFGIRTREITLYPIGGVARLERMPRDPTQELLIALAGPAVNLVLAAGLFAILLLTTTAPLAAPLDLFVLPFVAKLMWVNVGLALFNLIPAFPMDGGRVLRAGLAMRMGYAAATSRAAGVGRVLAIGLGVIGLVSNPFLLMIAVFVWFAATAEEIQAQRPQAFDASTGPRVTLLRSPSPSARPDWDPRERVFVDDRGRVLTVLMPSDREAGGGM